MYAAFDPSAFGDELDSALGEKSATPGPNASAFNSNALGGQLDSSLGLHADVGALAAPRSATSIIQPQTTSGTTPAFEAKGTIDSPLQLFNPTIPSAPVRLPFGLPGQAQPFPSPALGIGVNAVTRTLEAIPGVVATTLANFKSTNSVLGGGTAKTITLPFDESRLGLSDTAGSNKVQDTGTRLLAKYSQLQSANPGDEVGNILKATIEVPIGDALNAFATGGLAEDAAGQVLKQTAYDPEVSTALQKLGLTPQQVSSASSATDLLKGTFIEKAQRLVDAKDFQGLNELGDATQQVVHALNGEGIPALSNLGGVLQKAARAALSPVGTDLSPEIAGEISPRNGPPNQLPGNVVEPGQAYPIGLSTQRVNRVGGSQEGDITPEEPEGASVSPEAEQDWQENYSEQYTDLGEQVSALQAHAKSSAAAAREAAPQIAAAVAQQSALERHFLSKYNVPADTKGPITVNPELSTANAQGRTSSILRSSTRSTPASAEEAAEQYHQDIIAPAQASGAATVIGGDDLKEHFGEDYNDYNHPIYSKAAFQLYERSLKENKGDTVVFTGGGPGSGKSEILVKDLQSKGFNGIIYDSNFSSYEGAAKQIEMARAAGKDVIVEGILPNLHTARVHTILREQRTGRSITDKTFARGHAGFPAVIQKLLQNGILAPGDVKLLDLEKPTTLEQAKALARNHAFHNDPLALLAGKQYDETTLAGKYGREKYAAAAEIRSPNSGGITPEPGAVEGDRQTPDRQRANQATPGTRGQERGGSGPVSRDVLRGAEKVSQTPQSKKVVSEASRDAEQYGMLSEDESLELLANQSEESTYALYGSGNEEEQLVDNLTEIFAELQGLKLADLGYNFSQQDLENARAEYEYTVDALLDHPGRALIKYVSPQTGSLPEYGATTTANGNKSTSEFSKNGEDIVRSALGDEASDGGDIDKANEAVEAYRSLRDQVVTIQKNLRFVRKTIRLQKANSRFVESSRRAIAREVAKDVKALNNLVQAAKRAGVREGRVAAENELQGLIQRLRARRREIIRVQKVYNLTDKQMSDIRGTADPRFMGDDQFSAYLRDVTDKAGTENEKNITKQAIDAQIDRKNYKNPEGLRIALELPALSRMSLEELQAYDKALQVFETDDTFLGARMIQTIGNTDLGDIKTLREVRAALAQQGGVPIEDLKDVRGGEFDKFTYDANLAQSNPLYKAMVTEFYAKQVEGAQKLYALQRKLDELAKAARRSRSYGVLDKLIPQDKIVFDWLETPVAEQEQYARARNMTPAELEFGKFVQAWYAKARDVLIEKGTLKKWRESYVTHTTRSMLERIKDDGFIRGLFSKWKDLTDAKTDFTAVGDTGEVLGLEKFFKYSLGRSGVLTPSKNVARVLMSYAGTFYKKEALDAMIPKVIAYTYALQRSGPDIPKDPTGENIDGELKKFVKQWINNKKGRNIDNLIRQGGRLDALFRGLNFVVTMLHLGINIPVQYINAVPLAVSNFAGLTVPQLVSGRIRRASSKGKALMQKYPGVVGPPPFEKLISAASDIGDSLSVGLFAAIEVVVHHALGTYFLGSLTPEEYESGVVSPKRQAEIKLEMGRFHSLPGMESLAGNTTIGKMATLFKRWAIPYLFTATHNARVLLRAGKSGDWSKGGAKAKAARENFKLIVGSYGMYLTFMHFFGDDKGEPNWIKNAKSRLEEYLTDGFTFADPNSFLGNLPDLEFVTNISLALDELMTLQTYKSSKRGSYKRGESKGVHQLKTLFTPGIIKEFEAPTVPEASNSKAAASVNLPSL